MSTRKPILYSGGIPDDIEIACKQNSKFLFVKISLKLRSNCTQEFTFRGKDAVSLSRNAAKFICLNSRRMNQNSFKRLTHIDSISREISNKLLFESA